MMMWHRSANVIVGCALLVAASAAQAASVRAIMTVDHASGSVQPPSGPAVPFADATVTFSAQNDLAAFSFEGPNNWVAHDTPIVISVPGLITSAAAVPTSLLACGTVDPTTAYIEFEVGTKHLGVVDMQGAWIYDPALVNCDFHKSTGPLSLSGINVSKEPSLGPLPSPFPPMVVVMTSGETVTMYARSTGTLLIAVSTVITPSPANISAPEAANFNGVVATFTNDNSKSTSSDFTTMIDWGDGTPPTPGTISASGPVYAPTFSVSGSHAYANEGSYTTSVTVSDKSPGTGTANARGTATVTNADVLAGTAPTLSPRAGVPFAGLVATFSDSLTTSPADRFGATINWGDGTTSPGSVGGGAGTFQVSGTHTYATSGNFAITATLKENAPGSASAMAIGAAAVASVAPVPASGRTALLMLALLLGVAGILRIVLEPGIRCRRAR